MLGWPVMRETKNCTQTRPASRMEVTQSPREERGQTSREMSAPSSCEAGPFKGFLKM